MIWKLEVQNLQKAKDFESEGWKAAVPRKC